MIQAKDIISLTEEILHDFEMSNLLSLPSSTNAPDSIDFLVMTLTINYFYTNVPNILLLTPQTLIISKKSGGHPSSQV